MTPRGLPRLLQDTQCLSIVLRQELLKDAGCLVGYVIIPALVILIS